MPRNAHRPTGQRPLRVGEELRHALARIFERGELRDPDLAETTLTVTEVQVAPDLKAATVYVMPLGGAQSATILAALRRSAPYLRRALAQTVRLRHAPDLAFALDNSFEHASHIRALLDRPDVARDLSPDDKAANDVKDDSNGA